MTTTQHLVNLSVTGTAISATLATINVNSDYEQMFVQTMTQVAALIATDKTRSGWLIDLMKSLFEQIT